ncbi:hypothetical protein [Vibrio methylphosphonaticus]|uniref:hypothetical protein n=1 Tax=Vibrio methylphosphonaticus TaxID=2946866 RepID=UPI00202A510D|nr:hypothetical protein [Vibrio methylphosphonaticus]MCL9774165.1 hypothetical protein [Vibrio methylphosphonaticus]
MKRKKLPIPLILLVPIVLLLIVVVAGVYRFSLTDEEILAKFPSHHVESDEVVNEILGLSTPNPWTLQVPDTSAFSLLTDIDPMKQVASGRYDNGMERGHVYLLYQFKQEQTEKGVLSQVVVPFAVSNQGSGVFYYLGLFDWDKARQRIILVDSAWLGDRVQVSQVDWEQSVIVRFKQHNAAQSMNEDPQDEVSLTCDISKTNQLKCQ